MIIKMKFRTYILRLYFERHSDFSAFYQVFLEKTYSNLMTKIKQGDIVIDAGANVGMFTVIASVLSGADGYVISIEPDPENLRILKKNIELNNLKNIEIIDKALYSVSGEKIKLIQNGVMSRISFNDAKSYIAKRIEVETITFDDIIINRGLQPTVLKMDIEGAEKYALLGASTMMKTINYLECEIHSREDYEVLSRFSNFFYFKKEPIENMRNVLTFAIKHPIKILKLEYYNKFATTKRIMSSFKSNSGLSEYPIIVYGERLT
ncbi:MAG: FkbM family methyltransferase [Thermoplasmata archaeon]